MLSYLQHFDELKKKNVNWPKLKTIKKFKIILRKETLKSKDEDNYKGKNLEKIALKLFNISFLPY